MDDFADLMDNIFGSGNALTDMVDSIANMFAAFVAVAITLYVAAIIVTIAIGVFTYIFNGYTRMLTGRKAGLTDDWMAYVPFAWTIYRLRMVDEQGWKIFFLDSSLAMICGSLFYIIIAAIGNLAVMIIGIVLLLAYFVIFQYYKYYYHRKFYTAFDFHPMLALTSILPLFSSVGTVINIIIAYSNKFQFVGADGGSQPRGGYMAAPAPAPRPAQKNNKYSQYAQQPPAVNATTRAITCISGMYKNQIFDLRVGEELILGRDSSICHIILDINAQKISRKHCSIRFNPQINAYEVTDFSTNGTFLNDDSRIMANIPIPVQIGGIIYLGNRENSFMLN